MLALLQDAVEQAASCPPRLPAGLRPAEIILFSVWCGGKAATPNRKHFFAGASGPQRMSVSCEMVPAKLAPSRTTQWVFRATALKLMRMRPEAPASPHVWVMYSPWKGRGRRYSTTLRRHSRRSVVLARYPSHNHQKAKQRTPGIPEMRKPRCLAQLGQFMPLEAPAHRHRPIVAYHTVAR